VLNVKNSITKEYLIKGRLIGNTKANPKSNIQEE
jgi:hypothetical protein